MYKLPTRLEHVVKHDQVLFADLSRFQTAFSTWIPADGQPAFFPEYTDHNLSHFNAVLQTAADDLIPPNVWDEELFTPADAYLLAVATALHDAGMHLSLEGFKTLLAAAPNVFKVKASDKSWQDVFASFLHESKRWPRSMRQDILGSATACPDFHTIVADWNPLDWTEYHKRLIGEFLRRNHAKLARVIALRGVPEADGKLRKLFDDTRDPRLRALRLLAALIAESHGGDLRRYLGELHGEFGKVPVDRSHPPYCMALLRIADFLQIQSARAPVGKYEFKKIHSPYSDGEWRLHSSVVGVNFDSADREAVDVGCHPSSIQEYSKFLNWATAFQGELDRTWAVLGEVYTAQSERRRFGLAIRRLRHNLEDPDHNSFFDQFGFIPRQLQFSADEAELLPLLVGPLYDHDPFVGIRELVQNAVDATRERQYIENQSAPSITVDITTDEHGKPSKITCTDPGVGMDLDLIVRHFLRAGSSFRSSLEWRTAFLDEHGQPLISRSGKFGVGALAAFLLGDSMVIRTKKTDGRGIKFEYSLASRGIQSEYDDTISQGTEITITKLNKHFEDEFYRRAGKWTQSAFESAEELGGILGKSFWYFAADPRIEFKINGNVVELHQSFSRLLQDTCWMSYNHEQFGLLKMAPEIAGFRGFFLNDIYVEQGLTTPIVSHSVASTLGGVTSVSSKAKNRIVCNYANVRAHDKLGTVNTNLQRTRILERRAIAQTVDQLARIDNFLRFAMFPPILPKLRLGEEEAAQLDSLYGQIGGDAIVCNDGSFFPWGTGNLQSRSMVVTCFSKRSSPPIDLVMSTFAANRPVAIVRQQNFELSSLRARMGDPYSIGLVMGARFTHRPVPDSADANFLLFSSISFGLERTPGGRPVRGWVIGRGRQAPLGLEAAARTAAFDIAALDRLIDADLIALLIAAPHIADIAISADCIFSSGFVSFVDQITDGRGVPIDPQEREQFLLQLPEKLASSPEVQQQPLLDQGEALSRAALADLLRERMEYISTL